MGTQQADIVPRSTHLVLHCVKFDGIALHYRFARQTIFSPLLLSMHRFLTRLLLWLVVLALPLQGLAATTMMARGGALDDTTVAVAMLDDGAVMSDACHEHEDAMATGAESKAPAQSHCKTCPICAACSLGSVVPLAASLGVPLIKLPAAAPRGLAVSFRSFIPEALQRPPSIRV
ncbi:hypothetical protein P3T32_000442 [Ralstonia sp. GP73]|uniref:DUF2946 domain-containing protein n=4 Tax=Burkholderiaceae TaxID=119060 RepID=A0AAD2BLQ2_9RALS|nr:MULTISPECIES: hypothetical protein [Ralstonia]MDH6640607.1 hypothetical protein [Ralstonia sp. GP73]CAJ0708291.1 hypothetical protein LMG7143_00669 [Ralstonia sp. LMG 18095]CAJ0779298.1 hypothetical protein LMG18095_00534 [Ralstonia sp. LMG 18095]CAJ0780421.1 hypothetical protein R77560_00659 [Ralstonia sp. LMG 18095]CAJ0898961.1 hypothetical protein R6138_04282 [Ralstonia sp. LMG 18095]